MCNSHFIFIHGLSNKPSSDSLANIWLESLSVISDGDLGVDIKALGCEMTFLYWADLFYKTPIDAEEYESLQDGNIFDEYENIDLEDWGAGIIETVKSDNEGFERIPLPGKMKTAFLKKYLKELHHYQFNVDGIRDTILERGKKQLDSAPDKRDIVIVGHSLGTVIAYDLMNSTNTPIKKLITIGSPLGIDEVQDELLNFNGGCFPQSLTGDWLNVYDPLDLVSVLDPVLSNDYTCQDGRIVSDIIQSNNGWWRHSATKYFKGKAVRDLFRKQIGVT